MYEKPILTTNLDWYMVKEGKPLKWQMSKNMDSSAWPPSMAVLREKVKRTNLLANILLCSHEPSHSSYSLLNYGWQLDGDLLTLKWYQPFNEKEE